MPLLCRATSVEEPQADPPVPPMPPISMTSTNDEQEAA